VTDLCSVPVLGFAAVSGTGKTTLLTRLIPVLCERGLRCAVIKHSHHDVEIDRPGKDSHRLREAGAGQVILASPHRTFWVQEGDGISEPRLSDLLARLDTASLDLVLVEAEAVAHAVVAHPPRKLVVKRGRVVVRDGTALVEAP